MPARHAIVGGFILGACALGVSAILFFGGTRVFATKSRAVVFFPESVAGLGVGAPVTFHGVQIGSVQHIAVRFSRDTMKASIPVYIEIEPDKIVWEGKRLGGWTGDYRELVEAGLRAQLAQQSFVTGQLRVDLDFRPDKPAILKGVIQDIPEIPALTSPFTQLTNQITDLPLRKLADTAERTLSSLERLSNHLDRRLDPIADKVGRTADTATDTLQDSRETLRALRGQAMTVLLHMDALLIDARSQLGARGADLGRTLADADATARRARDLIGSIDTLIGAGNDFRDNLETTMRDLAAAASSLRGFAATIERNPNAVLIGRTQRR